VPVELMPLPGALVVPVAAAAVLRWQTMVQHRVGGQVYWLAGTPPPPLESQAATDLRPLLTRDFPEEITRSRDWPRAPYWPRLDVDVHHRLPDSIPLTLN
jgi:hypothetical protein